MKIKRTFILVILGFLASCQGELKVDSDQMVDKSVHVTGITLDRKQVTLKEGATITLVPTIYPENATNKKVSWSSGDVAIATVEEGKITAIKAGTTAIIAATAYDKSFCTFLFCILNTSILIYIYFICLVSEAT